MILSCVERSFNGRTTTLAAKAQAGFQCAPSVFVPGTQKGASTFLFHAIAYHPQVCAFEGVHTVAIYTYEYGWVMGVKPVHEEHCRRYVRRGLFNQVLC